jgi:hypothetical protein
LIPTDSTNKNGALAYAMGANLIVCAQLHTVCGMADEVEVSIRKEIIHVK